MAKGSARFIVEIARGNRQNKTSQQGWEVSVSNFKRGTILVCTSSSGGAGCPSGTGSTWSAVVTTAAATV